MRGFSVVLVDDVYECFTDYSQHGFNSTRPACSGECVFVGISSGFAFLLTGSVGLPCGFTNCLRSLLTFSLNIADFEALEGFVRVRLKPTPGLTPGPVLTRQHRRAYPSDNEVRKKVIRDDCNRYLVDREATAEELIPLIGKLHRENGVVLSIHYRSLVNKSVIELLKLHDFVSHIDGAPLNPAHSPRACSCSD